MSVESIKALGKIHSKENFQNLLELYFSDISVEEKREDVRNEYGITKEKRIVKNTSDEEKLNLIFTKENGSYSGTDSIRYPYKVIREELNLKCRFYDLRGSYATKILNNGIEIRDVADLLGHRNIETTENFYISSTNLSKRKAIEVFDNITNSDTIKTIINYE